MKTNDQENVTGIRCRILLTCCGMVVVSGCGSTARITPAEEWLKDARERASARREGTLDGKEKLETPMVRALPDGVPVPSEGVPLRMQARKLRFMEDVRASEAIQKAARSATISGSLDGGQSE